MAMASMYGSSQYACVRLMNTSSLVTPAPQAPSEKNGSVALSGRRTGIVRANCPLPTTTGRGACARAWSSSAASNRMTRSVSGQNTPTSRNSSRPACQTRSARSSSAGTGVLRSQTIP